MKQRKSVIALLLVAIIGVVGLTVAYFSSTTTFENEFQTSEYGTTYIEKFTSPDNWLPGDETEKTLQVTNSGNVDEAVRVKVEERWVSKKGTTLPLTQGDNVAALINFINNDDWTKVEVDGENYYYYYYNYKLAPQETTSKLLDKVTFNPLINAKSTCVDTVEDGVTTRVCNSDGTGYDGATYTLTLTVETVQYNRYQDAWNTSVNIAASKPEPTPTGVEYLATNAVNVANAEYNATTKGKMFQFSHTVNGNTVNEARYIGDAPNNYVYFNCDEPQEGVEYNYASSCEVWRILGTFDVERTDPSDSTKTITETRMKLVRGTSLATTRMWDNRNSEQYSSGNYGKNDWNESLMQTFLTGDYYNRTGEAASNGLKASAKERIEDAIFYLGGGIYYDFTSHWGNTEEVYAWERGTEVYNNTRPTRWEGKVALMYPSDMYMTYGNGVNATCYNDPYTCKSGTPTASWIYNSNVLEGGAEIPTVFLSPYAGSSNYVFYASSGGYLDYFSGDNSYGVRPVVYLKSDIGIKEGTGEVGNPYVLE